VFPKHHAIVFVHGCFWHRHEGCRYTTTPSTRPEFWEAKFDANVARDRSVLDQLLDAGWRVATVWECALRRPEETALAANLLAAWLRSSAAEIQIGNADVIADENAG
jgi:DNA mismatch endonuclease (patch repair protein)